MNKGGGGGVKERASERTSYRKDERGDRVKGLEDKRQNTRDTSQTSVRTRRGRRTIVSRTQTMVETGKNIERITRKMRTGVKHNRNGRIGNVIGVAWDSPRRRTTGRSDRIKDAQVTVVMRATNTIRGETLEGARGVIGQPSGNSHVQFGVSGG